MRKEELIQELKETQQTAHHYKTLIDESMDPTFSFYKDGTYRYVNRAFATGVGKVPEEVIGKKIWDIFDKEEADIRYSLLSQVFDEGVTREIEVRVPLPTGDTFYLTTVKPIINDAGIVDTVICTSKNITKRKLAEIALQEEHDKLLKALEEIKILSGFLPICASCKSVRDDKGYWSRIEAYLSEHSDLELSHGLCPNCTEKLYGQEAWYKESLAADRQEGGAVPSNRCLPKRAES